MARLPEADSLTGEAGEFLLYRLTGSPLFTSLKASIGNLSLIARDVLTDTPGKASFEWIQRAVGWIEALRDSVTRQNTLWGSQNRLAIPATEARRLLAVGRSLFTDIPEDLRKTFSKHKIIISTNKQTGKIAVQVGKGGAPHSVGGTAIRWCPLLFECLKADVCRLDEFDVNAVNICKEVAAHCESQKGKPSTEESVYNLYKLRDEICRLLEEGPELVVSPPEALVQNVSRLLVIIEASLGTSSNSTLLRSIAVRRYTDGPLLVRDRELLLSSLLGRLSFDGHYEETNATRPSDFAELLESNEGQSLREKCRKYFQKALERGMGLMGIDLEVEVIPKDSQISLCALKALEIEAHMFDLYQTKLNEGQLSEYQNKARSLRENLVNAKNPTLCSRVLLGVIPASELVHMTPEQLASQKVQQDRARAAEEAARFKTLTPGSNVTAKEDKKPPHEAQQLAMASSDSPGTGLIGSPIIPRLEPLPSLLTRASSNSLTLDAANKSATLSAKIDSNADGAPLRDRIATAPSPSLSPTTGSKNILKVGTILRLARSTTPPPPPRSLAAAPLQPTLPDYTPNVRRNKGPLVSNVNGGDQFTFKISDISVTFKASLTLETELEGDINGFIPEMPKNKGRLKADEFSNFLSNKLNGGNWVAAALRLTTVSELDSSKYKEFYKEYEKIHRIAMFELGSAGSKLFLVTPRFHGAAKALKASLVNKTSTYAIVLSRKY